MSAFLDVFEDATKQGTKVPTNQYLSKGKYPIIDQGQNDIAGYTNQEDGLFENVPAIIFGDHTRVIKYVDKPCFLGADGVKLLKAKDSKANYKYLYYVLSNAKIPDTGYNRHFKWLKEIDILLYDMETQCNIVKELDKVTDLINKRKQQLSKLDELVKARFVELFGDSFNNKKWDTQKLRNISVSISDGSNVDKAYYKEKGDVLFLRIQNVWFNEFRLDDSVYISEDVNNEYLDTSLHHGDLLITKIGRYYTKDSSLGRVSVYLGEDDKANYSNNIMRVRLTDEVCSEFVNVLMNLDDYNRYIREVSVGGTDKRALSKAIIGDLPIIMPPKELQIEFLEFVKQTDKSKLEVQKSLEKLELLKKALMQKYFG
ncbi:MAG: restriction endonuclease subunit S [Clostridia bacterium]|nr:restriction endonuclease subunit S [Clostridia bacterium]